MKELITYFGLACLISWGIWLPLYGHIFGVTTLPTFPFHHAVGGLGPLFASILTTWIYGRTQGLKKLFRKCIQVRPLIYLLIAMFGPLLLVIIASGINYFVAGSPIRLSNLLRAKEFPDFNLVTFFIYNLIFFGFGEEAGWRGFALSRLQNKMNALNASVLLAFLWAIWHLPLFFYHLHEIPFLLQVYKMIRLPVCGNAGAE